MSGSHGSRLRLRPPVTGTLVSFKARSAYQGRPRGGQLPPQPPADGSERKTRRGGFTHPVGLPSSCPLGGPARPAPRRLDGHGRCRGTFPARGDLTWAPGCMRGAGEPMGRGRCRCDSVAGWTSVLGGGVGSAWCEALARRAPGSCPPPTGPSRSSCWPSCAVGGSSQLEGGPPGPSDARQQESLALGGVATPPVATRGSASLAGKRGEDTGGLAGPGAEGEQSGNR